MGLQPSPKRYKGGTKQMTPNKILIKPKSTYTATNITELLNMAESHGGSIIFQDDKGRIWSMVEVTSSVKMMEDK